MNLSSLVIVLLVAQIFGTATTMALPALAPEIAADFGVSAALIGYQFSVFAGAMLVSLLLGGNLARRWGPCRVIQCSLLMIAAACLLATLPLLVMLLAASIFLGLGYGLITPASSHLLARFTTGSNRNLVFSIKQTGVPAGALLAAAALPSLALAVGWRPGLMLVAAAVALLAVLLQIRRGQLDDDRDARAPLIGEPLAGIAAVRKERGLLSFSLAGGFFSVVQACLTTFTVVLFVEQIGYTLVAAGLVLAASQIGGVAGRVFWGWLADRLSDCIFALMALTLLMILACALVVAVTADWPLVAVYALFFLFGATSSGWNGAFLAEVARLSPRHAVSATTGGSLIFVNAGTMLGAGAFTNVYALVGSYTFAFGFLVLPSAAGLACLLFAQRAMRRPAAPRVS